MRAPSVVCAAAHSRLSFGELNQTTLDAIGAAVGELYWYNLFLAFVFYYIRLVLLHDFREAHCDECGRHYWAGLMGGRCDRCHPSGEDSDEDEDGDEY